SYFPGGPVKGWWLRGEWGQYRDRFAPGEAITGNGVTTVDPAPFTVSGWSFSTGYNLGESRFACLDEWVKRMEFTFRYECMQNLFYHDLVDTTRQLDVFHTSIYT